MEKALPLFLFAGCALALPIGLLIVASIVGPKRKGDVKRMPYESGMDPIHDTRRRFDVRFHLVAIAFLIFDVELLFIYPWAVASRNPAGIDQAVADGLISGRGLVFAGVHVFLDAGRCWLVYEWRKGVSCDGGRDFRKMWLSASLMRWPVGAARTVCGRCRLPRPVAGSN